MDNNGRITFYNSDTGEGKLILNSGGKFDFSIDIWDDFGVPPETGNMVECYVEDGILKSLASLDKSIPTVQNNSQESKGLSSPGKKQSSTYDVSSTLKNYFSSVEGTIGESSGGVNKNGQLDYFLSRRFLITSYNNLKGLDPSLHDHKIIKKKLNILQDLHKAYYAVTERVGVTDLAFEMIFLRSQPEYIKFLRDKQRCLDGIASASPLVNSLSFEIENIEAEIEQTNSNKIKIGLEKRLKKLRGNYVDAVHKNASLTEELNAMVDIKAIYTEMYFKSFEIELSKLKVQYKKVLSKILSHKAYDLDYEIWKHASKSKLVQEYFKESGIIGDYSTKTFLKYYLKTLSKEKLGDEQRDLFKLLNYLELNSA